MRTISFDTDALLAPARQHEGDLESLSREIDSVDWERGTAFASQIGRSPVARADDRLEVWIAILGGLLGVGGYFLFT